MSDAAKCGLPEYHGSQPGIVVYAAKITAIEPYDPTGTIDPETQVPIHRKVTFGELADPETVSYLDGAWVERNHPQAGGYFVVPEGGGAGFMHAQAFEKEFTRAEA